MNPTIVSATPDNTGEDSKSGKFFNRFAVLRDRARVLPARLPATYCLLECTFLLEA